MSDTKARRLSVVRNSSDALRLDQGEAVHVGVDVHKATYHVAVFSGSRGLLATWVQPARPELLIARLGPIKEQVAGVVYEAGPTGFGLARRLRAAGLPAQVIATSKVLAPVGQEAKCDRLDCRRLALLASKGPLHPVRIPTEQGVVVVSRLDRLARSTRDLLEIAEQLNEAQAGLKSLHEPWADTTSPAGRMVLTVFAGIAEFERELIRERTHSGRKAAKARGVRFGRPPKLTADQVALARRLVTEGTSIPEASKILNVHRSTLYRALPS